MYMYVWTWGDQRWISGVFHIFSEILHITKIQGNPKSNSQSLALCEHTCKFTANEFSYEFVNVRILFQKKEGWKPLNLVRELNPKENGKKREKKDKNSTYTKRLRGI